MCEVIKASLFVNFCNLDYLLMNNNIISFYEILKEFYSWILNYARVLQFHFSKLEESVISNAPCMFLRLSPIFQTRHFVGPVFLLGGPFCDINYFLKVCKTSNQWPLSPLQRNFYSTQSDAYGKESIERSCYKMAVHCLGFLAFLRSEILQIKLHNPRNY